MKKALILDLDNTIYPVSDVAEHLFEKLFILLDNDLAGRDKAMLESAKDAITRKAFHVVADEFNFSPGLKNNGIRILKELECTISIKPFDDYYFIKQSLVKKFLVTTGFTNLQNSKVKILGITDDFDEIHIVDPELSSRTKKDVFEAIMRKHNYQTADLLVIGDDPYSEIKAALELGIDTFLFDPDNEYSNAPSTYTSANLKDVLSII